MAMIGKVALRWAVGLVLVLALLLLYTMGHDGSIEYVVAVLTALGCLPVGWAAMAVMGQFTAMNQREDQR